jgi:hypothetical protein
MAVRMALQCSESDSQLILGDNNSAARLLSRPGEAIYNDAGGLVENNSPFQIAWLPDEQREQYLVQIDGQTKAKPAQVFAPAAEPVVFEGNSAADITASKPVAALLSQKPAVASRAAPVAYLGEPVAIKEATSIPIRRQAGANVLIIGQQEEPAMALCESMLLSLVAQAPPGARFYLLDGSPADSMLASRLPNLATLLKSRDVQPVDWRTTPTAIADIAKETSARQDPQAPTGSPPIFLFIYALQRYRMLRRQEESFSFSSDEQKPDPGKDYATILREGPALGIHTITWCDTLASLERTVERAAMREFDHRILLQMNANDSSSLIDSPVANKLGPARALAYSEEKGTMEKFRPYGLPPAGWLAEACARLVL